MTASINQSAALQRARRIAVSAAGSDEGRFGFVMFCIFTISYYLHLTQRLPALGAVRFDLALGALTLLSILFKGSGVVGGGPKGFTPIGKRLLILLVYIALSLPFVEWPGSVLNKGLDPFLKAVSFYFFVTSTVTTVGRLKTLIAIFVACQSFRILEPLYLHITTGYWGSFTYLGNSEFMDRLSGGPSDIINPNGLGFLVVLTIPMLHFLVPPSSAFRKILYASIAVAFLYALVLTASRSSFLALIVLVLLAIWRSKRRVTYLGVAICLGMVAVAAMNDLQRERYLSIFSHSARGSATAEGRLNGVIADFGVAMHRPLFGHGLGNSREANANFGGFDQLSHNLYSEIAQELGFVGLALFLFLLAAIVQQCYRMRKIVAARKEDDEMRTFFDRYSLGLLLAVQTLIFFSLASYGLSESYWYFLGGLVTAAASLASRVAAEDAPIPAPVVRRGAPGRL